MPIPSSQLETWSHQGSITESSETYASIRRVLRGDRTPYAGRSVDVFLQGSYGNDTNIYAESDVDVVVLLEDCWQKDLSALDPDEKAAYEASFSPARYGHAEFRRDVRAVLGTAFGSAVTSGNKAINIAASGSRRKADVIPAIQFRRYRKFRSTSDQDFERGICFFTDSGQLIVNFPKQHSENCTRKHQDSDERYKPLVRTMKNLRTRLVEAGAIARDLAPSYYLEGLLYNVPVAEFAGDHRDRFVRALNWIIKANRTDFVCANEQYYLLREESPVTWGARKCDAFLDAVVKAWDAW